jgi:hypothetical protein
MKKVELVTAYEFQCEECGRRNYVPSVQYEPSEEDATDHPELGEGIWCSRPNKVVCEYCKTIFEAVDAGAPEDDEE